MPVASKYPPTNHLHFSEWSSFALRVKISVLGYRWLGWKWIATWTYFYTPCVLENLLKLRLWSIISLKIHFKKSFPPMLCSISIMLMTKILTVGLIWDSCDPKTSKLSWHTCSSCTCDSVDLLTVALWSLTLMIGSFFLKSHTTQRPQGDAEANMCCTCLFHDTQLMLSGGKVLLPGVRGLLGFVRSQM